MTTQKIFGIMFWLLLAVILVISIMPAKEAPTVFADDKLNHMLAFFTLSLMARISWTRMNAALLFGMLAAFGGGIELLQWMMGFGRDADWWDFAADILAIAIGILAGTALNSITSKPPITE